MTSEIPDTAERDPAYFSYYGMITHQQNMLQDYIRTGSYHTAITTNPSDFKDKVVLDVGAGSGILSFFCAQAGAKKVYAVEASPMAKLAEKLVKQNGLEDVITVIQDKVENLELPEMVDVIVSEPIGVLLVHERMIESFIFARNKFLKRNVTEECTCQMYPSRGSICLAPFSDAPLYTELMTRYRFWEQTGFYGVDLTGLKEDAFQHYFEQPIVGTFDARTLMANQVNKDFDFHWINADDLIEFEIPFEFKMNFTGVCHGIAGWFDLAFEGTDFYATLSTSPAHERTHWYQIRFVFSNPLAINIGQVLKGVMKFKVNSHRSYVIKTEAEIEGTCVKIDCSHNLHEQQYSFLNPTNDIDLKPESICLYSPPTLNKK
ncbi:S-adenosyl-L-methionine-dependent methyltransferase [Rozella allomycis CSF55]|uniref:type I protein arginine methyltransferase n=1 Tax=Rozella allomycis (strain CSF55) TaxID=988480 RepID=A0A075ARX4_ROZAC|nr:Protein arginine N-methyltransferase domain-containing protein [Rozella allomycis CSF55]RKP19665.1 S-adenosyl-L-methionine-dependent methyltransferase [Rozella allomycis CSF55]|eukprot:EPZ31466.1 Protein arginine N-methyltransferase domain-containing protein [Rozella allomycis CSF55]